jgi:hypothetical protein
MLLKRRQGILTAFAGIATLSAEMWDAMDVEPEETPQSVPEPEPVRWTPANWTPPVRD